MPFSVTDLKTTIADVLDPLKAAGEILVTQDAAMTRDIVDKVGRWTGFHFNVKLTGTPVDGEMSLNGEDLADAASITVTLATKDVFGTAMTEVVGDIPIGSKLVLRTNDGFQFGYVINSKSTDVSDRITFTLNPVSTNADFTPYTAVEGHSIVASFLPLTGSDGSYRLVFGTHVTFDNETLSLVTDIQFPTTTDSSSVSIPPPMIGDRLIFRKLDGESISFENIASTAGGVWSYHSGTTGISISASDVLMLTFDRYANRGVDIIGDTQFTDLVPQAFAASTRSLLRNNSADRLTTYPNTFWLSSYWDSNQLQISNVVNSNILIKINTSFIVVPSTSDCSVLIEWGLDDGSFTVIEAKTVTNNGATIYINENFNVRGGLVGATPIECRLTFDKNVDVYSCSHKITFEQIDF